MRHASGCIPESRCSMHCVHGSSMRSRTTRGAERSSSIHGLTRRLFGIWPPCLSRTTPPVWPLRAIFRIQRGRLPGLFSRGVCLRCGRGPTSRWRRSRSMRCSRCTAPRASLPGPCLWRVAARCYGPMRPSRWSAMRRTLVETHRAARRAELPDRRRRVNVSFDLQSAALAKRRAELSRAAAPATERGGRRNSGQVEIAALKREQAALSGARERALRELDGAPDRIVAGSTRFLVHALALPPPADSDIEQMDERVEAVAVRIAAQAEVDHGGGSTGCLQPGEGARGGSLGLAGIRSAQPLPKRKGAQHRGEGQGWAERGADGTQRVEAGMQPWGTLLALRGVRVCDADAATLPGAGSVSESAGVGTRRHGVYD